MSVAAVEVSQREEAYEWLLRWLADQPEGGLSSHNYRYPRARWKHMLVCEDTMALYALTRPLQPDRASELGTHAANPTATAVGGRIPLATAAEVSALSWRDRAPGTGRSPAFLQVFAGSGASSPVVASPPHLDNTNEAKRPRSPRQPKRADPGRTWYARNQRFVA